MHRNHASVVVIATPFLSVSVTGVLGNVGEPRALLFAQIAIETQYARDRAVLAGYRKV